MMNSKRVVISVVLIFFIIFPVASITIKLGSPFPERTPWDNSLKQMAAEWRKISRGQVQVRIYPGGVAGAEEDMVRKMRFGQLDAAVFTAFGMQTIVPNTFIMSLPGILQSEEELDFAIENFSHIFDKDFIDAGFRTLAWSKSGWAYFFSENPARTIDQMHKTRLAVSGTSEDIVNNFKTLGFNVIPMALNEVMVGLQSGMVTSIYCPPIAAAAYQWFAQVPYMLDFQLAPVIGSLVISERTWQRIPAKYHKEFMDLASDMAKSFFRDSERLNKEALEVMKANGLEVLSIDEDVLNSWFTLMRGGHSLLVGKDKWIDQEIYDEFIRKLEEFR